MCAMRFRVLTAFINLSFLFSVSKGLQQFVPRPERNSTHVANSSTRVTETRQPYLYLRKAEESPMMLVGGSFDSSEGSKYVVLGRMISSSVEWQDVEIPLSGLYNMRFRYMYSVDNSVGRDCDLFVNDSKVASISFPGTGSVNTWMMKRVTRLSLLEGQNSIRLVTSSEGHTLALDWFKLKSVPIKKPTELTLEASLAVNQEITYRPGELTVMENGLLLSTGLESRIIARSGKRVETVTGEGDVFHSRPDGADVFLHPNGEDYVYASNSEVRTAGEGGVGAIFFNKKGEVTDYKMVLTGTKSNCSGGRTPWNTWLSAEEHKDGQIHEVDPFGRDIFKGKTHQKTRLAQGTDGGDRYEAVTCDNREASRPKFYYTVDSFDGQVTQFVPDDKAMDKAEKSNDYSSVLESEGEVKFLVLSPKSQGKGTFEWVEKLEKGKESAEKYHQNCEGIEFSEKEGELYVSCKKNQQLFIIKVDEGTYKEEVTQGRFGGNPDQMRLMCFEDDNELLYFAEEGGTEGVHARYPNGQYVPIVHGVDYNRDETTGVAFSPNKEHMYYALQEAGYIIDVWRKDRHPFNADTVNLLGAVSYPYDLMDVWDEVSPNLKTPSRRARRTRS